ncbi:MAG: hypothetical protein LBS31_11645 [Candidatus Adiutrix sp.]|jgi:hypothetical protein|nr:hypothetical protein [Candidatus Adiutrix sp.]
MKKVFLRFTEGACWRRQLDLESLRRHFTANGYEITADKAEADKISLSTCFSTWAGLGRVKKWVDFLHRAGLADLCGKALLAGRAYTPIILTCRKRG